jgi:hypothetical protein
VLSKLGHALKHARMANSGSVSFPESGQRTSSLQVTITTGGGVFGTREPEAMERIRHGHAVLGAYTNDAGATVVTSGSTDWSHGLAGRDPEIEQITRNVLTRLG